MPSNRNPMYMDPEAIVAEINDLREGLERGSRRIYELSKILHDQMRRRTASREDVGVYVTYANSWTRFAGMVQQGLQRTRQADRVLRLLSEAHRSRSPEAPQPEAPPVNQAEANSMPVPSALEDFISLYGEESIRDASDGQR